MLLHVWQMKSQLSLRYAALHQTRWLEPQVEGTCQQAAWEDSQSLQRSWELRLRWWPSTREDWLLMFGQGQCCANIGTRSILLSKLVIFFAKAVDCHDKRWKLDAHCASHVWENFQVSWFRLEETMKTVSVSMTMHLLHLKEHCCKQHGFVSSVFRRFSHVKGCVVHSRVFVPHYVGLLFCRRTKNIVKLFFGNPQHLCFSIPKNVEIFAGYPWVSARQSLVSALEKHTACDFSFLIG